MKKLLIIFMILITGVILNAQQLTLKNLNINGSIGYTTVSMGDAKNVLDESDINKAPFTNNVVSNIGNGIVFSIESMYKLDHITPGFAAGLKYASITCTPGTVTAERTPGKTTKQTLELNLSMVMIGISYSKEAPNISPNLTINSSIFIGLYAPLWGAFKMESNDPAITGNYGKLFNDETTLEGSCVPIDINIRGDYKTSENIFISGALGYRIASVKEVKYGNYAPYFNNVGGLSKGELLRNPDGTPMSADFSGLTLSVGVTYQF